MLSCQSSEINKSAAFVLGGGVALEIMEERQEEEEHDERLRSYYVALRRHDGATDEEIAAEIPELDRDWHVDLVLADGNLEASKQHAKRVRSCIGMKPGSKRLLECRKAVAAQTAKLRAAGLSDDDL